MCVCVDIYIYILKREGERQVPAQSFGMCGKRLRLQVNCSPCMRQRARVRSIGTVAIFMLKMM